MIFLQFYVYDLRFRASGPTTFFTEFQTLHRWYTFYRSQFTLRKKEKQYKDHFSHIDSYHNKVNLRDLIAATGLVISNWIQIIDFSAYVTLKFDGWPWKTIVHFFYTTSSFGHHLESIGEVNLQIVRKHSIWVKIGDFFVPCDLEIWWMTLKNNRATLLYNIKLCASLQSHGWIQTGVTVRQRSIRVKIGNCLSCVTLKFDKWPWKTIGHLSYAASSFVHHFIAMGEFKLELKSGKAQFGSKWAIFCPVWPWNLTDDLENQ